MRKTELSVDPEIMDVILEAVDMVKLLLNDIKAGDIRDRNIDTTTDKLQPYLSETANAPVPSSSEPALSAPAPQASVDWEPPVPSANEEATASPSEQDIKGDQSPAHPAVAPIQAQKPVTAKAEDLADNTTVRVDVKRLDDLMNQVGELVLERNRMMQLYNDFQAGLDVVGFRDEFGKLSKRLNFVTSELQMQVLKMRIIPVEKVFKKFPRIVRNLARELHQRNVFLSQRSSACGHGKQIHPGNSRD